MKLEDKSKLSTIALILVLTISAILVALPTANAQPNLIMNCGNLAIINSKFDVDLNGPSSQLVGLKFASKAPGATEFTLSTEWEIDNEPGLPGERYVTDTGGDCDIDVFFDQMGDWEVKWVHPATGAESNVVTVEVVLEIRIDAIAFIGVAPNPIGVNQPVLIHTGITYEEANVRYGWHDLSVTIEKPNGEIDTISDITTDATGGTGITYTPSMAGIHKLQTHFPEQLRSSGQTMSADVSEIMELVVQADPVPYHPGTDLPDNYWTRPIHADYWEWTNIAGNFIEPLGYFESREIDYNIWAPESAHLLWTKRLILGGGLAGGATDIQSYEDGAAYEDKMRYSVTLGGVLYYNQYESRKPSSADQVVAVDLHTGEELWRKPLLDPNGNNRRLSFAQAFYWDSYNYHGVYGYLWATSGSTWYAFEPTDGTWDHTLEGVPSGWKTNGPNGEFLIYRYRSSGVLSLWNSSRAVSNMGSWRASGRTIDADDGIEWEKSVQAGLPGGDEDVVALYRMFGGTANQYSVDSWAFNLEPGHEGELIYSYSWPAPAEWAATYRIRQIRITAASIKDGVFTVDNVDYRQHWGFDINTGHLKWGPTVPESYATAYGEAHPNIAVGKLFSGGQGGTLYCYDINTGILDWKYDVKNPYAELTWTTNYPIRQPANLIVDGKIYIGYGEHSPFDPKPRGAPFVCIDIETGDKLWEIPMASSSYSVTTVIGDSIIAMLNAHDGRIYAIGKGPSTTTVEAPLTALTQGESIIIRGTVMDVSPGTDDIEQQLRFPKGVPAMSDEDMSVWMQHVYMQLPSPDDVEGVEVTLKILDPNGDYYGAKVTTDKYGMFSHMWAPAVVGEYYVTAMFEGSESYFPSTAATTFGVAKSAAATFPDVPTASEIAQATVSQMPAFPYIPTAEEIAADAAQRTINMMPAYPDVPTASQIAQETVDQTPLYSTMDLVIIVLVVVVLIVGLYCCFVKKQK